MSLLVHQFKTDARHFWLWLVVSWIAFAANTVLMSVNYLSADALDIWKLVVLVWQVLNGVFLIAALIQADPLVGTSAAWLTRPIRRAHLFWAKSAFIVLLILLPRVAMQGIGWSIRGFPPHLWLCAAGQSLMFSATFALVTAVLAALTRDLGRFFLAVALAAVGMFVWTGVLETLEAKGILHQGIAARNGRSSLDGSQTTAAYLALFGGALIAWICQARLRLWRAGVVCLGLSLMAAPLLDIVWRVNFLMPRAVEAKATRLALWTTNTPASSLTQRVSKELVVINIPPHDVAVLEDVSTHIRYDGEKQKRDFSQAYKQLLPAESPQDDAYLGVIRSFFPAPTLWFNNVPHFGSWSAFGDEYTKDVAKRFDDRPPPGTLSIHVEADLFAVKKIAELPLKRATLNFLPGQWVTVQNVRLIGDEIVVSVAENTARVMWDRDMKSAGFASDFWARKPSCLYVLYEEKSDQAVVVEPADENRFSPVFDGWEHRSFTLRFPFPALRARLLGVTATDWMQEARLCVFAPVYDGTITEEITQDHYKWIPSK